MLPIIYYETTVLYLDDNKKFLKLIEGGHISDRNVFSTNAEIIREHINKEKSNIAITSEIDIGETQERYIRYDLSNLRKRLDDPNKEDEISVLVVDYDMPKVDGISFCRQINKINPNIYKIFLTGTAEKDEVIDAMQDGLIDFYISKSDKNLMDKLRGAVLKGKKEYFKRVCRELCNILLNKIIYRTYIDDSNYINFIKNIISSETINQYCLIEDIGSYFIKEENKEKLIIVSDEEKQKGTVEYLKDMIDRKQEREILEGLQILDNYSLENDKLVDKSSIMYYKYIYPSEKIPGFEKVFFATKVIKNN